MYDSPHQFEPASLSDRQWEEIQPIAESIVLASLKLTSAAHESTRATLRELVRQMTSYYSNRIEGQHTHPHHIERALQNEFSNRPDEARLQRIALAHIGAEKAGIFSEDGCSLRQSAWLETNTCSYRVRSPPRRLGSPLPGWKWSGYEASKSLLPLGAI